MSNFIRLTWVNLETGSRAVLCTRILFALNVQLKLGSHSNLAVALQMGFTGWSQGFILCGIEKFVKKQWDMW